MAMGKALAQSLSQPGGGTPRDLEPVPEDRRGGPTRKNIIEQQYKDNERLNRNVFHPDADEDEKAWSRRLNNQGLGFDEIEERFNQSRTPRSLDSTK